MVKNSLSSTMKIYMLYHKDVVLPTERYYVYFHRNPLTNKVFYVGAAKGNPLRAYEFGKHRSEAWKKEVLSFGGTCNLIVEIVHYCKDPIEAQELEFKLIYDLKSKGEAYCSNEGDTSFQRRYPKLQYHLYLNDEYLLFTRKTDLYGYCKEKYGFSRNIVNSIIESDKQYYGLNKSAHGLKIVREGKEKM